MPVGISSCGQLAIGHRDGECGVARAAGAAGTLMFVSGATSTPIEEIMAVATGPVFYQLYYLGGRERSEAIVERVKRAGVQGIVLTVDSAAPSRGPRQPAVPGARAAARGHGPARGGPLRAAGVLAAAVVRRLRPGRDEAARRWRWR